ncbi:trigger factor [Dubosiella newyorkensis]|uniref:trigger factor n=1 Tax=Dubosiella newyorkensis TaxID=1862672 RepID=UPI00272B080F|nr:trigger factor [Dubosiella newyorkensis]
MKSNWTIDKNSTGVLSVTVDAEEWQKAQKKAFNKLKSGLTLKGFRKGQIPDAVAKKTIGSQHIQEAAIDEIANDALQAGIKEFDLDLVSRPILTVSKLGDDEAVLDFTCTVSPEVTLGDYSSIRIEKPEVSVSEEEVDAEVKHLQDRYADWVLREEGEPAQIGDQVTIDFVGEKDGIPFEGGAGNDYPLVLGSNTFIPGFEDQLVGIKSGEEKDIEVTFPVDYQAPDLAGQAVIFKVKAHDIKYKELPEINDELVKNLKRDGVETVEQYKEQARNALEEHKTKEADEKFTNEVLAAVVEQSSVEIPQVMIDQEVNKMYQQFEQRMQSSGFTAKQFLEATHQSEQDIKDQMKEEAAKRVKTTLVLEAIANNEHIEIPKEKIDEEYKLMSDMYQMPVEQIKAIIVPENIEYDLKQQQALDLLKKTAQSE